MASRLPAGKLRSPAAVAIPIAAPPKRVSTASSAKTEVVAGSKDDAQNRYNQGMLPSMFAHVVRSYAPWSSPMDESSEGSGGEPVDAPMHMAHTSSMAMAAATMFNSRCRLRELREAASEAEDDAWDRDEECDLEPQLKRLCLQAPSCESDCMNVDESGIPNSGSSAIHGGDNMLDAARLHQLSFVTTPCTSDKPACSDLGYWASQPKNSDARTRVKEEMQRRAQDQLQRYRQALVSYESGLSVLSCASLAM
eukprot:TRINITY_DN63743_c0_g1_i1.p1 TRINITY_DN63743_c0_g1~~TRINITY_DN63743_c0_g1_i1.p1  ORF type:complete len:252 (-),score=45.85 TRINITY_DN63743_c0_g1_i1:107-862(-)